MFKWIKNKLKNLWILYNLPVQDIKIKDKIKYIGYIGFNKSLADLIKSQILTVVDIKYKGGKPVYYIVFDSTRKKRLMVFPWEITKIESKIKSKRYQ